MVRASLVASVLVALLAGCASTSDDGVVADDVASTEQAVTLAPGQVAGDPYADEYGTDLYNSPTGGWGDVVPGYGFGAGSGSVYGVAPSFGYGTSGFPSGETVATCDSFGCVYR
jgi:hypothetical protein